MDLHRFIEAQSSEWNGYDSALTELKSGRKTGHWIWYVFPTIYGWANSVNHIRYGIHGTEEARAYLTHPILGSRLREITGVILAYPKDADPNVFMMWETDAKKLLACMTFFDHISPNDIFKDVCDKFFNGRRSKKTLQLLGQEAPAI